MVGWQSEGMICFWRFIGMDFEARPDLFQDSAQRLER